MNNHRHYFDGLPPELTFLCKTCGNQSKANSNRCSHCQDADAFYFGEIKRLTSGSNNLVIGLGILGAFITIISFFTRFAGIYLLFGVGILIFAEYLKYKNNNSWFLERQQIINLQKGKLNNFDKWNLICKRIESKEKEEFVSQWLLKKANENIPGLK